MNNLGAGLKKQDWGKFQVQFDNMVIPDRRELTIIH